MTENRPIPESDLRTAWGPCPEPKFDEWIEKHGDVISERVVEDQCQTSQRRIMMRVVSISAAIAACLLLVLSLSGRLTRPVFAQAIEQVHSAKSIVWKHEFYLRATSTDEKRTWLHKISSRRYYQPPGRYRIENLNRNGKVVSITIRDLEQGRELILNPRTKKAKLATIDVQRGDTGPLKWILESMEKNPLEMLAPRSNSSGVDANVFRRVLRGKPGMEDRYLDYWIAPKTKQLVQFRNGIEHPLDPETAPDGKNAGERKWKGTRALGTIESEFELNKDLPQSLFSLDVPKGYELEVVEKATITETEMLEYLTTAVKFSDNKFPETPSGMFLDQDKYNAIFDKPKPRWSEEERQVADIVKEAMLRCPRFPLMHYVRDHAVPESFRYIGNGASFGEEGRIVCWYQLKSTKEYRAIYGDLSIKKVDINQLPLAVRTSD